MNKIKELGGRLYNVLQNYLLRVDKNLDRVIASDIVGVTASIIVVALFIPVILIATTVAAVISIFK